MAPSADSCVALFTSFPTTSFSPDRTPGSRGQAGFRLTIRPTVLHPRYFISSECFAEFIGGLDLSGKHVVDIGTGSGILALAAARAGAENIIATDINPNAALTAVENARANGMDDCVTAVCTNHVEERAGRKRREEIPVEPA